MTFEDVGGVYGAYNPVAGDSPLGGVKVYAYWMDDDGAISPTYYAPSDANGRYSILMKDWTDAQGKVHTFDANGNERLKVWAADVTGYHLSYIDGKNALSSSIERDFAGWDIATKQVNDFNAAYQRDPAPANHLPQAQWTQSAVAKPGDYGTVSGRVFADLYSGPAFITFPNDDGTKSDPGLVGIQVVASWKDKNGTIVETKYAYTDANGNYTIKFDGGDGDGSWSLLKNTWNTTNAYVSVVAPAAAQYATRFDGDLYANLMSFAGVTVLLNKDATNLTFPFKANATLNVVTYDSSTTPAAAGTVVQAQPTIDIPLAGQYKVVWTDPKGTVMATCSALTVDPTTMVMSPCPMTVPATLAADTIYRATLYATDGSTMLAADSFLAKAVDTTAPTITPIADQKTVAGTPLTPVQITTNDPTAAITVAGLPAGVTFDPATGTISGTPTASGTSAITVTATDAAGNVSTETFTITVTTPADTTAPKITPLADQTVQAGNTMTPVQITTDDPTATLTAGGLPTGVTFDPATGMISGTPMTPGTYPVTVTATDGAGNTSTETFTITVNPVPDTTAPAITPIANQTGTVGTAITPVTITTNDPTATITVVGLPAGVTFDSATGQVTGTPTAPGTSTVTVAATDPAGNVSTSTFTFTVAPKPDTTAPTLTPIADQTGTVATAITPIGISSDDPTATITVTGLPAGVTYDPATGQITGTPTTLGNSTVTITATDGAGNTSTETFTITVKPVPDTTAPIITPIADQQLMTGSPLSAVSVHVDDPTATVQVTGLPAGVTYDPASGMISGTPASTGESTVTVTATDPAGNVTTETFVISVGAAAPVGPVITPVADQGVAVGTPIAPVTVTVDDPAAVITVAGLPAGVTYDPATRQITGTPTAPGTSTVTITATSPAGVTMSETFVIAAATPADTTAPGVTPISDQAGTAGTAITPVKVTSDDPTATITVTGLPAGVSYDPATGQITGTPTVTGTFTVTVTATDPAGNVTTETFTLTVNPAPDTTAPIITPITDQTGTVGSALSPINVATNDPTATTAVAGLPGGVTYDPATGLITGTPTVAGTFPITVVATDAAGNTSQQQFTLTVAPAADTTAPHITPIGDQWTTAGQTASPVRIVVDDPTATLTVAGLPTGATYDPSTGAITGTPTAVGVYPITVTATDKAGNATTETFVINVGAPADTTAPSIQPIGDKVVGIAQQVGPIAIVVDDLQARVVVSGLPAGVSYDPTTRQITGAATMNGTYPVTVTAIDAAGNAVTEHFVIQVGPQADTSAPVIVAVPGQTGTVGRPLSPITVTTNDPGATITVTGLPAGVTFDPSTHVIAGTPTTAGTFPVTVVAIDAAGNRSERTFTLTVSAATGAGPSSTPSPTPVASGSEEAPKLAKTGGSSASDAGAVLLGCAIAGALTLRRGRRH